MKIYNSQRILLRLTSLEAPHLHRESWKFHKWQNSTILFSKNLRKSIAREPTGRQRATNTLRKEDDETHQMYDDLNLSGTS